MSCGDPSSDNYVLKDENNQPVASAVNGGFHPIAISLANSNLFNILPLNNCNLYPYILLLIYKNVKNVIKNKKITKKFKKILKFVIL